MTHEVVNQAPPRAGLNEYLINPALTEAVKRYDAQWASPQLSDVGALVGEPGFQHDAELANIHPPVFARHDRWGNRVDAVEFHPAYHRIMGAAIEHGAHTSCWSAPKPGAHVARAATFMLFAQVEPGHACPVSMTHAVVPSLRFTPDLAEQWLPKVYARVYDPHLHDPAVKTSAIFGMAMTEKQGGSDVRANTTRAVAGSDGTWSLTGHKWFCSAPQSDAFLVLAQAPGGLSCFLVPRVLPGGERNVFRIQRLKDKLGNKSNASSEIELDGTTGWLLGEEGRGVRTIIEMVAQTRLDCVLGSAAGMRQSVAEAAWHVRHRRAFGDLLIDQPAMTSVIADLQLEAEAATWTALRLAAAYDCVDREAVAFRRLATAVAKYWVCKRGPNHAYEALECLGGNGYTESFPLARRYREQPVMAVWEGSGNVIALDVLRAMAREPDSVDAVDRELASAMGVHAAYDQHVRATRRLIGRLPADPSAAAGQARRLVESLALGLQAAVLIREAPAAVADGFVAARLGPDRSLEYGALGAGLDLTGIVARA
ncbi:putative acyl-CoA dehydrogenase [Actinoplanes missouriensis 431]|uniref:Putative acyl-CoA dehydrogenase n=1 Tax=Actinoplanes missouriensis (strain ATCC 14538 / DSM 43046 / CBS 188.64 / JCM 3121 / NBRC 102363 / NCIMB 12654 / NRRL B-3342 / UNCC 431) TaxID=512565 RepID=I0H8B0_ACTM4|nr:acyl-CoA dehydrogenase family protein [Actinoplanes missouriensis]BAL89247.1 putative acyl-CoA dehydrogenase [Actinoplanes missouriensis 431]